MSSSSHFPLVPNSNGRKPLTTTTATLRSTIRVCQTGWQDVIHRWHYCHWQASAARGQLLAAGDYVLRVTRNSDLYIDEEEVANLLKAVENELHNRRKGDAVRLEVAAGTNDKLLEQIRRYNEVDCRAMAEVIGWLRRER